MKNPLLAGRYAKSLLETANAQNITEAVVADVKFIKHSVAHNQDLLNMLRSPVLPEHSKQSSLQAIFGEHIQPLSKNFLSMVLSKKREYFLPEMLEAFIDAYNVQNKILKVQINSAAPLTKEVQELLESRLQQANPGYTFTLSTKIDPSLIGGFTLQMGDKLVDASIKKDLHDIKMQFQKNLYVKDIR